MLTIRFNQYTRDSTLNPLLTVAYNAIRIHNATADGSYTYAREISWLAWMPPIRLLPDTTIDMTPQPDKDDWEWLQAHADLIQPDANPADTMRDHALRLVDQHVDKPTAILDALTLNTAAHVARRDPRSWARAYTQTNPARTPAATASLLDPDPALGFDSMYGVPALQPGVTGPAAACALTDRVRFGDWYADHATNPQGQHIPIPDELWSMVERRMGADYARNVNADGEWGDER